MRLIAAGATATGAVILSWSFASAVVDGFDKKREGEVAVIAPTYEERDPGRARSVPDFSLKDRYGKEVKLEQFAAADLLVVNIWSSTCPPCIKKCPRSKRWIKGSAPSGGQL